MSPQGKVSFFSKIRRIFSSFVHAPYLFDALQNSVNALQTASDELYQSVDNLHKRIPVLDNHEQRISLIESVEDPFRSNLSNSLIHDHDHIFRLNRELSINPVVWGSSEKLSVSPTAAVFSCFFNTNSGTISVGDYTFAGSRVSILAGSHDPALTGFLRRDAELADGCDIVIGNGVWLASCCTILGPCVIHDNAVIAAGAVVTPGTEVPANTVFGGVPAKQIGTIDTVDASDLRSPAVLSAIERCNGFLYVSGWSSRINEAFSSPGHWIFGEGVLLTRHRKVIMEYRLEDAETAELLISGPVESTSLSLSASANSVELDLPVVGTDITEIRFRLSSSPGRLLITLVPRIHTISSVERID